MSLETKTYELFMKEALKQAKKAYEEDEIPIGAVIVCDNTGLVPVGIVSSNPGLKLNNKEDEEGY